MSFFILSSWLTVLSGDFLPGLQHHPFLSIQHPVTSSVICFQSCLTENCNPCLSSMLPRITHQEAFFKFLFDTPMTIILEFLLLPDQKMIILAFIYVSVSRKNVGLTMSEYVDLLSSDPSFWSRM